MTRTKEEIYARNNEYRRKKYQTDETFREYYRNKAREYAQHHRLKMSAYLMEWRKRKRLENINKNEHQDFLSGTSED